MQQRAFLPLAVALCGFASCAHRNLAANRPVSGVQNAHDRQVINAVDAGDGDLELRTLRARLDANPADLAVRLELAQRYLKLGFPEVAIEHCRLACERAPDSDQAHIALAKTLRDAGRTEEGATVLRSYTSAHASADYKVWSWLGLLLDAEEDWKNGESAHRRALALAPERGDLHNNFGYCLLRQGRKKEAAEEFHAALRIDPHSTIASNNLAAASASPKEAVESLQSVTDAASAHNNMAVVLIERGQYADARREIQIALSYNRQHSAALSNLALISQLDGKPAEIKAAAQAEGRWVRVVRAWRRLWGSEALTDSQTTETGSSVASR